MSWLGFGKKTDTNAANKAKIIKDLSKKYTNLTKPQKDNSLLEISFDLQGQYSTLRIFLSHDFPISKPTMFVQGPLFHTWLDQQKKVIGCEALNNWSKTSDLVEVVNLTIEMLKAGGFNKSDFTSAAQRNPGSLASFNAVTSSTSVYNNGIISNGSYPAQNGYQSQYTNFQSNQLPSYQSNQQQPHPYGSHPNQPIPSYGSNSYKSNQPSLSYGTTSHQQPPAYGSNSNQSPAYRSNLNQPPVYGSNSNQPPPYGSNSNQPPAYGSNSNQPPAYGSNSNQPPAYGSNSNQLPPYGSSSSSSNTSSNSTLNENPVSKPAVKRVYDNIDIPTTYPELKTLTEEQLFKLMKDSVAFKTHVQAIAPVGQIKQILKELKEENDKQSSKTLTMMDEMISLTSRTTAAQKNLVKVKSEYSTKLNIINGKYSLNSEDIKQQLMKLCDDSEKDSEFFGDKYCDNGGDISSFTQEYLDKRMKFHTLQSKLNCLK